MMSNTGARAQTELIWNIIWHQYDRYRSLGFQSWPCIYRSCLGDCYTPPPPPAGNLKALDLRLPVTPGRLGLKRQHGDLLRVAGEEDSVFFHVGFFSRMTVRTCFVLAAFVAGLQRAVSGCVTAHCNGWTLQAGKKSPCSLHIFISFCSCVRENTRWQTSWLVGNQCLVSVLISPLVISQWKHSNVTCRHVASSHILCTGRSAINEWITIKKLRCCSGSTTVFLELLFATDSSVTPRIPNLFNQVGWGELMVSWSLCAAGFISCSEVPRPPLFFFVQHCFKLFYKWSPWQPELS